MKIQIFAIAVFFILFLDSVSSQEWIDFSEGEDLILILEYNGENEYSVIYHWRPYYTDKTKGPFLFLKLEKNAYDIFFKECNTNYGIKNEIITEKNQVEMIIEKYKPRDIDKEYWFDLIEKQVPICVIGPIEEQMKNEDLKFEVQFKICLGEHIWFKGFKNKLKLDIKEEKSDETDEIVFIMPKDARLWDLDPENSGEYREIGNRKALFWKFDPNKGLNITVSFGTDTQYSKWESGELNFYGFWVAFLIYFLTLFSNSVPLLKRQFIDKEMKYITFTFIIPVISFISLFYLFNSKKFPFLDTKYPFVIKITLIVIVILLIWYCSMNKKSREKKDKENYTILKDHTEKLQKKIRKFKGEISKINFLEYGESILSFKIENDILFKDLKNHLPEQHKDLFSRIELLKDRYLEFYSEKEKFLSRIKKDLEKYFGMEVSKTWRKNTISESFVRWFLKGYIESMRNINYYQNHFLNPKIEAKRENKLWVHGIPACGFIKSEQKIPEEKLKEFIQKEFKNLNIEKIYFMLNELEKIKKEILDKLIFLLSCPVLPGKCEFLDV